MKLLEKDVIEKLKKIKMNRVFWGLPDSDEDNEETWDRMKKDQI